MAETEKTIAVRVQAHLRSAGRPVPALPDIIPLIASALALVGRRVSQGQGWRGLQKIFTPTITNGYCDLSGESGILFNIRRSEVRFTPAGGSEVLAEKLLDNNQLNQSSLDALNGYCAPYENGLRFRAVGGSTTFNGTASITTSFIPTVAELESAGLIEAGVLVIVELSAGLPAPIVTVMATEQ
jgi:hypothetical protein